MGRAPALTFRLSPRLLPMTVVLSAPPARLRIMQRPTGTPPGQRRPHLPVLVPFQPRHSWRILAHPPSRHLLWLLHFRKVFKTKTWNLPPPLSYHRQAQHHTLLLLLLRWRKTSPPAPWSALASRASHWRSSLLSLLPFQLHPQRRCNLFNRHQNNPAVQSPKVLVQQGNSKECGQTTSTLSYPRCERVRPVPGTFS